MVVLHYLRILARIQIAKIKPDIIGITGSAGKSSTRDAIYNVLKTKYKCKITGKANSESGIPLDILGLEMKNYSIFDWLRVLILAPVKLLTNWERYEKYIVEMGVDSPDEPKNMQYLLKIIRPRIGVFVNAFAVHSEAFDKLIVTENPEERKNLAVKLIAEEKGNLIKSLPKNGWAVLNFEDKNVKKFAENITASVFGIGFETGDLRIKNIFYDVNGFRCDFELNYQGEVLKQHFELRNQILGPQYAITFALAIGAGLVNSIAFDDCVDALRLYKLPPGRMSLIRGIKDSLIIDSSYNASAETVLSALNVLEKAKTGVKKIAVLGDMRELGKEARFEHERAAAKAAEVVDEFVLIGPMMKEYFIPKLEILGFSGGRIHWFENSAEAAAFVKELIKGNEVILVKGSQNTIYLERVVEAVMDQPETADELLCRRGEYWEKIRRKFV